MLKYNNNKRRKWKRKRKRKGNAKTGRRVISASGAFEIEERNLAQWCVRDLKMKLKPMDDIMWNRWFSWQRQPIFGTWAVDISSSSARYTFRGDAFDFWPHRREDSRLSASLHHLSREKETSLLHRDYRTFFLSIFSSITPTFLSLIPCLLLLPIDVHIYIYIHLLCPSFSLGLSCQMTRTIDFLADTAANIVECKTNRGSYDRSYDTSTVFLACLETLKGKVLSKTSSDPSFTGQVRISTERRNWRGKGKGNAVGRERFRGRGP